MDTLKELRKELKAIDFKLTTRTLSWGKHATYKDSNNNELPSVFTTESKKKWQPLIDLLTNNKDSLIKLGKQESIIALSLNNKRGMK